MALERELAVYREHLPELLVNEGRHVVIKGEEIAGHYGSFDEALEAGYGLFGLVPFLVKQIRRTEPILFFSRHLAP